MLGRRHRPDPAPSVGLVGTAGTAAMFAVAVERLGWRCAAVTGPAAEAIAAETGAVAVDRDELVGRSAVDIAVLADDERTGVDGAEDADRLVRRGVHVMAPATCLAGGAARPSGGLVAGPGRVGVAEPFATAPAVQGWFRQLREVAAGGSVTHLSGRAAPGTAPGRHSPAGLDRSLLAVALLATRLARWGPARSVTTPPAPSTPAARSGAPRRVVVDCEGGRADLVLGHRDGAPAAPARWELQAASAAHALRVELLPVPLLEVDGAPVESGGPPHPAEVFGFAPLLRTFWADVTAGHEPALGVAFAADLTALADAAARSAVTGGPVLIGS